MATEFLSRSIRDMGISGKNDIPVGPGSYNIPTTLKTSLPSFTGFSSSAKRNGEPSENKIVEITPGPGAHDVSKILESHWSKNTGVSVFKSGTKRFDVEEIENTPGPSSYTLPSTLNAKKPKKYRKAKLGVDVSELNPSTIPSIPNRFQSLQQLKIAEMLLKFP